MEDSFLQQVARQPHEWLPRLIFADWLEERGDPRGELIRLSHQLTRLDCEGRQRKEARLQELSAAGMMWPSPSLVNSLDLQLVLIPPGEFRVGSPPGEKHRHNNEDQVEVTLTQGFWMGQYEVTQAEWEAVMGTTPWKGKISVPEGDRYPATWVCWNDASQFCVELTGKCHSEGGLPKDWRIDLPTEAQWEYACRAGTTSRLSFGDVKKQLELYGWFEKNAGDVNEEYAHQVGQKKPNPWGLYDMHGNVFEWCRDSYSKKLPGGTDPDPQAQVQPSSRVFRGGGFSVKGSGCRSVYRLGSPAGGRGSDVGFRVALVQTR